MLKHLLFILPLSLFCYGCASYQDLKNTPAPDLNLDAAIPQSWANKENASSLSYVDLSSGWVATFSDPNIDKVVQEVVAFNYDLRAAEARLAAARASAKKAGAALSPSVGLSLGAQSEGGGGDETTISSVGASVDIAWEADVWGRIRAGKESAGAEFEATESDLRYARESLVAQAVKAYFLALETSKKLQYSQDVYENYIKTLDITQSFFDEGQSSIQDVHLAKSELSRSSDELTNAKNIHKQALRSLEILMGRYPSGVVDIGSELPSLPDPVPSGIPSEVLERRPDIIAAERRVAVAFGITKQAKAARLPQLSLTGSFGGASSALSEIASPTNIFWNVASNILAPVFDGGQRKADVDIANAKQREAVALYQKTALAAFADVEGALANEQTFQQRLVALEDAYEQAKMAEKIVQEKYEQGEGLLLDVQQVQRQTISNNIELLQAQARVLSARVDLYLALGGDYKK